MRFWLAPFITPVIYARMVSASPPAPSFVTQPSTAGGVNEGDVLTLDAGVIINGAVALIEWQRGGEVIPGAVGLTYQRRPADIGQSLRAHVIVVGAGGSAEAFSADAPTTVANLNRTTFAPYDGVTFNGATAPLRASNYIVPLIGEGVGQGSLASTGNNGLIANGRLWSVAGLVYTYGPQRADQSVIAHMNFETRIAGAVQGVMLRANTSTVNGYHLYWVESANVWRLSNGNTAVLAGFGDIADAPYGERRLVLMSAIGTQISYVVINPATMAVIGARSAVNATYATGWGGMRSFVATVNSETTGIQVDYLATFTADRASHAVLAYAPPTTAQNTQSADFMALILGTPPATTGVRATATLGAAVAPAGDLAFAPIHANHPHCLVATFKVTPVQEGNHSVALASAHMTPLFPKDFFSVSAAAPTIRPAFTVFRGADTPLNCGDVNLNALLLTAGYVDKWTIAFVSGTGGAVAADWAGLGTGRSRFPTRANGATHTAAKGYVFSFTSEADAAITVNLTVTIRAGVVSVSKQADIDAAMGLASSTNIALAGKTVEICRAATGFASGLTLNRHNSQLTSANQMILTNEDDANRVTLGGLSGLNNNRVTFRNLRVMKTDGTAICSFTATNSFNLNDQAAVGLIFDGALSHIEGPASPNQFAAGLIVRGTANANPIIRDLLLKNVGSGLVLGSGIAGVRIASILAERVYVLGFSDNAFFFGGTTGTCRDVDCIAERPRRDRRFGQNELDNTHLDDDQGPDGETYARRETERFIGLQGSGDAGCQSKFANGGADSGYEKNIIVLRPSGAHAWRRLTNWRNMEYSCGTLIHSRQAQHPNGAWLGSDSVQGENTPNGSPSLGLGTGDDSNSARRIWSMGRGDATTFTGGIAAGVGLRSRQIGQSNAFSAADNPADLFTGWAALAGFDWSIEVSRATRVSQVLELLKPIATSVLHLPDGTYIGAVANDGGVAKWNDEAVYA